MIGGSTEAKVERQAGTTAGVGVLLILINLAGPGAGSRYRVWGWAGSLDETATGAHSFRLGFGGFTGMDDAGTQAGQREFQHLFPGGLAWPENLNIEVRVNATVAAQGVRASVYYTVEAV